VAILVGMTRRTPHKSFKEGTSIEFRDEGPWIRGTYLNAYGTWHIVEDGRGNRMAVPDRDIRERSCARSRAVATKRHAGL